MILSARQVRHKLACQEIWKRLQNVAIRLAIMPGGILFA